MAKSKGHIAGGGIASRQRKEVGYRQGAQRQAHLPAGVAQLGQRQGNHVTEQNSTSYGGLSINAGIGFKSELGNAKALELAYGKGGPGKGRNLYASGSQGQQGGLNPGSPMTPSSGDLTKLDWGKR